MFWPLDYIVELDGYYLAPQNLVGLAIFGVLWAQGLEEVIQIWRGLIKRQLLFREVGIISIMVKT